MLADSALGLSVRIALGDARTTIVGGHCRWSRWGGSRDQACLCPAEGSPGQRGAGSRVRSGRETGPRPHSSVLSVNLGSQRGHRAQGLAALRPPSPVRGTLPSPFVPATPSPTVGTAVRPLPLRPRVGLGVGGPPVTGVGCWRGHSPLRALARERALRGAARCRDRAAGSPVSEEGVLADVHGRARFRGQGRAGRACGRAERRAAPGGGVRPEGGTGASSGCDRGRERVPGPAAAAVDVIALRKPRLSARPRGCAAEGTSVQVSEGSHELKREASEAARLLLACQ